MKKGLLVMAKRFDALSLRDRLTLVAGGVAALVGVEMLVIGPLHDKRAVLVNAAAADAQAQAEQLHAAQAQRRAELAELQARGLQLNRQLAEFGLDQEPSRNPSSFIVGAVHGTQAALVSLRALPVEGVAPATVRANDAAASAVAAVAALAAASAPAPLQATLFRHRAELKLQGSVQQLTAALGLLEHGLAPLRIEQVLLTATQPDAPLQATIILTAINRERTWFAL